MKGHKLKFNGRDYLLTEEQYNDVCAAIAKTMEPTARALEMKAAEARFLWDDLEKTRKETFFLTREIADAVSASPFPKESLIKAAETAADKVKASLRTKDPHEIAEAMSDASPKIEAASIALHSYLDSFFAGTDSIIKTLTIVRNTCAISVGVLATVASAGATVEVGTAVMASEGGYQQLLKEIERSGTDPKITIASAATNVLTSAATGALTRALLGNEALLEDVSKNIAEKAGAVVLKRYGSQFAEKLATKIVAAEISGLVGKAIEDVVKACKPGSKMTLKQAAKDIATTVLTSAAVGGALSGLNKQLEELSDKSASYFKPGIFAGLGEVDPKKAFGAGGDSIVEQAVTRLGVKPILAAASNPKNLSNIGKALAAEIAQDATVNRELAELVKKKKLH